MSATGEVVIDVTYGDSFAVARDYDGYLAVQVQNKVWAEEPRWITCSIDPLEAERYLLELEQAVRDLRQRIVAQRKAGVQ